MPDTGAPWNIPYVAGTDLVADWPTDNQQQAEAIADALDLAGAGIGSNLGTAILTATQAISTGGWTSVTDLSVAITPAAASSRVLLVAHINYSPGSGSTARMLGIRFAGGNAGTYVGDAEDTRSRVASGQYQDTDDNPGARFAMWPATIVYVDSPATTSEVTYTVEARAIGTTGYINRQTQGDTDSTAIPRGASSLTAIEVIA